MTPAPDPLIDPTLLFRFEIAVRRCDLEWTPRGITLSENHRLPCFSELAGRPVFADVRMGWSEAGIGLQVKVAGKRALPWCRDTRPEDSDGFHVWIDTRCSPDIHRATQYCHRMLWMPSGGGPRRDRPVATSVPIVRARGNPKPIRPADLRIVAHPRHDGYELSGIIPAESLTGYAPADQARISLFYAVIDRERGWQTLALGPEYPITEDPSLWAEAVLA